MLEQVTIVALLILVLTSANAMNLILSRGLRRRQETAVRLALGISRGRLIRQLLVEATVLALSGAVIAIVTGAWVGNALRHTLFPMARWTSTLGDTRVVLVTLALSLVVGICTGIFPALQVTDLDLVTHAQRWRRTLGAAPGPVARRDGDRSGRAFVLPPGRDGDLRALAAEHCGRRRGHDP